LSWPKLSLTQYHPGSAPPAARGAVSLAPTRFWERVRLQRRGQLR
jgi:hypothetical protein